MMVSIIAISRNSNVRIWNSNKKFKIYKIYNRSQQK